MLKAGGGLVAVMMRMFYGDDCDDDYDNDGDDNVPCQFSKRTNSAASIRAKRAAAGVAHHMCNSQA